MTPLHLDILLHYYAFEDDFDQIETNRTRWEYAFQLAREGYLFTPDIENKRFEITEYGKRQFIEIMNFFSEQLTKSCN